jgi:diguanylate cyclase (GGDEF)-like protein
MMIASRLPSARLTRLLDMINVLTGAGLAASRDVASATMKACSRVILVRAASVVFAILSLRRSLVRSSLTAVKPATPVGAVTCACEKCERLAEQQMAQQFQVLSHIMDSISQGLMMFDRDFRLVVNNAAANVVFGLPAGTFKPGMRADEVLDVLMSIDAVGGGNIREIIAFYTEISRQSRPTKFNRKCNDGRTMAVNCTPVETGWILTFEDVTDLRKADERIAHMAHHDALTGLPNRIMLRLRAEEALPPGGVPEACAVMCLDLDRFKNVNDTLGHPAGDKLLCEVSRRLQSVVRRTDVVARLGGDEFAILVMPLDSKGELAAMASRLVEAIREPFVIDGQVVFVGTSVGITVSPDHGQDVETLMQNADLALYQAKNDGRGRFAFFDPSLREGLRERRRMETEMRIAVEEGRFELRYQPVIEVRTRRILGFEALMRWRHPDRGLVPPDEFIPIAEDGGMIAQLTEWALQVACQDARRWPDGLKVAVNLSPILFRGSGLVAMVAEALAASGLEPNRLELEITESAMMRDPDETLAILVKLKAIGVRVLMDDFGTGYSSLAYLKTFPFDKVKLDKAFVRDIDQPTNLAIIRAVIGIAESLPVRTVIEGVESESQFRRVAAEGSDEVQGFLFSRAVPASEIETMLSVPHRVMATAA